MGREKAVGKALRGKQFNLAIDLGCGPGRYGELFKKHCAYLIGIDHNLGRLSVAKKFSGYDEVVFCDIRDYTPPPATDAVFLIEVVEHLPKQDAIALLNRLSWIPFILVTTPSHFHKYSFENHHVSVFTEQDLRDLNFSVSTFSLDFFTALRFGHGILGVKER